MADTPDNPHPRLRKELILFGVLLALGLFALPVAVYLVGNAIFGAYADGDYFDFAAALWSRLSGLDAASWFLVLSPYLAWQALRFSVHAFRRPPAG